MFVIKQYIDDSFIGEVWFDEWRGVQNYKDYTCDKEDAKIFEISFDHKGDLEERQVWNYDQTPSYEFDPIFNANK